jgi:hypothetical protein
MSNDTPCPGCGLAVPAGYPRCPRCHAAMPAVTTTLPLRGSPRDPGGTSLAEEGSRKPALLIGAVLLAVVVAVVAVVILMRSGDGDKDKGKDKAPAGAGGGTAARPSAGPAGGGADPGPAEPDEPPAPGTTPSGAPLDAELQNRRLWATVSVEGTVAVVSSAYCADPGMDESLRAAGPDLAATGVTAVRCNERHGPLVFERPVEK